MSSQLQVTKELQSGKWIVTGVILDGSTLPKEVFLYENDDGELGKYQGVANLTEMTTRPVWYSGIPSFGNRIVRFEEGVRAVDTPEDADKVETNMVTRVTELDEQMTNALIETTTYTIP